MCRTYLIFSSVSKPRQDSACSSPRPRIKAVLNHRRVEALFEQPGEYRELRFVFAILLRLFKGIGSRTKVSSQDGGWFGFGVEWVLA
jgi:hypothetical protein